MSNDAIEIIADSFGKTGNPWNFQMVLPEDVTGNTFMLLSATIPLTELIFSTEKANRKVVFNEGGSDLTVQIDEGNYTLDALSEHLSILMTSEGAQLYTVERSERTGRLSISAPFAFSLKFSEPDTAFYELGWDEADTSFSSTQEALRPPYLAPERYCFVEVSGLPSSMEKVTGVPKGHFSLKLNGSSYAISVFGAQKDYAVKRKLGSNFTLDTFWVKLYNRKGEFMYVQNDVQFVFGISTE